MGWTRPGGAGAGAGAGAGVGGVRRRARFLIGRLSAPVRAGARRAQGEERGRVSRTAFGSL
ncbi:hypothetical protein CP975_23955 [Streptomyces alboniger]|uniref:Uncharacterized protein n=1 Tax=Streptomyces alboniger TaxID=132473 RepID=A0A5J6HT62_STRAD|nr:hypothetical protein CP975_23955 [Streptomyces alboniger]